MAIDFFPDSGGNDSFLEVCEKVQTAELIKMNEGTSVQDDRLSGRAVSLFHTGPTPRLRG
jgi:hypothetical protein